MLQTLWSISLTMVGVVITYYSHIFVDPFALSFLFPDCELHLLCDAGAILYVVRATVKQDWCIQQLYPGYENINMSRQNAKLAPDPNIFSPGVQIWCQIAPRVHSSAHVMLKRALVNGS